MPQYVDRLAEAAKRLTPGVGEEILQRVGAELLYAIILENDRPEHQALMGTRLWIARQFLAQSAGNFCSLLVGAGGGVNYVTTIMGALVRAPNPAFMAMISGAAPGTFVFSKKVNLRDSRLNGLGNTAIYTRAAAQQVTVPDFEMLTNTVYGPNNGPFPIVVANTGRTTTWVPYFETEAVNLSLDITLWGYERVADAHEVDSTVQ